MKKPGIGHFLLLSALCCSLLISCNREQNSSSNEEIITENTELRFGNDIVTLPQLSKSASDLTFSWGAFEDFDVTIKSINGESLSELKNTTERLIQITDSLAKKIPDSLDTQPIRSRLIVVTTEARLLRQQANKGRTDSSDIALQIANLEEAASEFYFHIEEKLQKDAIDMQRIEDEKKELEKQKRFLDSVYQAELEDQQN